MIGPSYPFKGGIAAYTTQFYRELVKNHQVLFCSFRRQYPALLYPGDSDKDPGNTGLRDEAVLPTIDSLNPLSWRLTARKIADFRHSHGGCSANSMAGSLAKRSRLQGYYILMLRMREEVLRGLWVAHALSVED